MWFRLAKISMIIGWTPFILAFLPGSIPADGFRQLDVFLGAMPLDNHQESFDKDYDETIGRQTTLLASNIAETRKFSVKTPEIVVNVNPDRADLVDIQVIDGRKCLVIPIDEEVEVNGISVNAK